MTIARSAGVLIGTDETTGVTIGNNATTSSSETDILGADDCVGEINLFLKFTSTVAVGTVDVSLYHSRVAGQAYSEKPILVASVAPINGTQKVQCNVPYKRLEVGRYITASVKNNATGANITNVLVGYELFKVS